MGTTRHRGARFRAPLLTRLAIAGLAAGLLGAPLDAGGSATPAKTQPRRSTEASPGYVPLVDPESTSVAIGRRLDAPLVSKRFTGGARSLDELGRAVCRALHRNDRDELAALCVRQDEFRDILWREFPQSRPVTGLLWDDGWRVLGNRLTAGVSQAIQDQGGRFGEFLDLEVDSVTRYRNFTMHSGVTLVVRDDGGRIQRMGWVRAVVERKGVFKLYSTDD